MSQPNLLERLREVAGGKRSTPADLEAAIAQVEESLAMAQMHAAQAREQHAGNLLALIAADDVKGLAKGRHAVAEAQARAGELSSALTALRERLATLRHQEATQETRAHWAQAEALLAQRSAAMRELQDCADAFAAALAQCVQLSDAVWAALPELPGFRPAGYGRDLPTRVDLYLLGATDGRLGSGALSAHVARQRPDLVRLDLDARALLLRPLHEIIHNRRAA